MHKFLELHPICLPAVWPVVSVSYRHLPVGIYSVWYVRYFLCCKIWRELNFVKFCGNSPQKGGLVHQKGGRSEGKRGSRQMYDTATYQPSFPLVSVGKIPGKYRPIPNRNTESRCNSTNFWSLLNRNVSLSFRHPHRNRRETFFLFQNKFSFSLRLI